MQDPNSLAIIVYAESSALAPHTQKSCKAWVSALLGAGSALSLFPKVMGRKVSQQRLKCQDCVEQYPEHDQALTRDCWEGSACIRYRSLLRRRQTANLKRRRVAEPIPNVELKWSIRLWLSFISTG